MNNNWGVIFDMDGVLVDSNPAHKTAIRQFCDRYNLDLTDAFLEQKIYGRTNKEWIPELFGDLPETEILRLADEKEAAFRDSFDPKANEVPGAVDFLNQLHREGVKMLVATSAPRENADYIISALGIGHCFEDVLDSSHVEKGKPEPEVYLKAADRLNLPPSNCIVFEDSIAGVEAANRAGAVVFGLTTTHSEQELKNCRITAEDFRSLTPEMLKSLTPAGATG